MWLKARGKNNNKSESHATGPPGMGKDIIIETGKILDTCHRQTKITVKGQATECYDIALRVPTVSAIVNDN